jgi:hypothetical protein
VRKAVQQQQRQQGVLRACGGAVTSLSCDNWLYWKDSCVHHIDALAAAPTIKAVLSLQISRVVNGGHLYCGPNTVKKLSFAVQVMVQ